MRLGDLPGLEFRSVQGESPYSNETRGNMHNSMRTVECYTRHGCGAGIMVQTQKVKSMMARTHPCHTKGGPPFESHSHAVSTIDFVLLYIYISCDTFRHLDPQECVGCANWIQPWIRPGEPYAEPRAGEDRYWQNCDFMKQR